MTTTHDADYLLGHEPDELARLERQARMLAPATRTILREAGLRPGMRVLDLGTGPGDVAFAAAEIVGPTGAVVGIDQGADALASARRRARDRGLTNVAFDQGDVSTWQTERRFDAVVGRLILLFCPDPAAVVRHHARHLVRGGVIVAMEYDMPATRSEPPCPLVDTTLSRVIAAFRHSGLDPALGTRLESILASAGLTELGALGIQSYLGPTDGAQMAAGITSTLLPVIRQAGIASAEDVDIATLEGRLAAELTAAGAITLPPTLVGAWGTTT